MGCRVIAADALMKIVRSVNWGIKRDEARHSAALRRTQLTMLRLRPRRQSLPPLPPSKPCAEVADPPAAALRGAVVLPPRLDATSTKRRVNVVAAAPSSMAVDLRPSSVQLVQHSPLHQNLPATYEPIHVNARARMPYSLTSGRSGRRTGSPRLHTRAQLPHGHSSSRPLRPSSQRHRAPVPQPDHAHEDHSPTQPPPGCPPPAATRIWNTYTWKLCRAPADHMGCQSTSGPRSFS